MLSIRFPSFTVLGAPYDGGAPHGFYVKRGGLQGLDGTPTGAREAISRPAAHGEFDLPVFRGPRVITIDGIAVARSEWDLQHLRSLITGCGATGDRVSVSVTHQGHLLSFSARVVEASFVDRGDRSRRAVADFMLNLVCADPRKYGKRADYSGNSVTVSHDGNFPASPVVTVAGPRTGPYTISGPDGRQVTVTQSLTAGQTHRIDFRTGRITRNGVAQLNALGRADLWTIPPGTQVPMAISSGLMTVTVTDTYM